MRLSKKRIALWTLAIAFGVAISLPLSAADQAPPKSSYVQANVNQFKFVRIADPSSAYSDSAVVRFVDYELRKVCYIKARYGGGTAMSCIPL